MHENSVDQLLVVAQELAIETPDFFEIKGPGPGNHSTNDFMKQLQERMTAVLGQDFSEKKICGANAFAVDFYFSTEATIVEIALGLPNSNTEYERDVIKAVMAKGLDNPVKKLVFISKPGAQKKCSQAGRVTIKEWLEQRHKITMEVHELHPAKSAN